MPKIAIIGAGGHGREVLGILLERIADGERIEIVGFIDEDSSKHDCIRDGFPVLGDFSWFETVDPSELRLVCTVGIPRDCYHLVQKGRSLGLDFASAISLRACISPYARIGHGVMIFPNVAVNTGAAIGNHVALNAGVTISHDTEVGDFCNVNPGAHLAGGVTVGEGCNIGMGSNVIQGVTIVPGLLSALVRLWLKICQTTLLLLAFLRGSLSGVRGSGGKSKPNIVLGRRDEKRKPGDSRGSSGF